MVKKGLGSGVNALFGNQPVRVQLNILTQMEKHIRLLITGTPEAAVQLEELLYLHQNNLVL